MKDRLTYVLWRKRFSGGWRARLRAFYWCVLRRWETEICEECGRPVRQVWWCHDPILWQMVTGHEKPPGRENAAGIWCIRCFDEQTGYIEWVPVNLTHLHDHA